MSEQKSKNNCIEKLDSIWDYFLACFQDPRVTEILLKGSHAMSIVQGLALIEAENPFPNNHVFVSWVQNLARSTGVRLDPVQGSGGGQIRVASPAASSGRNVSELKENALCLRWHCVLPPISVEGPLLSLRRHLFHTIGLMDFNRYHEFQTVIKDLWSRVRGILIAGPTGSGKTTFLSALLHNFARLERLVILETLPELPSVSPHSVHLCERPPSVEGVGAVGLDRLLVESLRLRPDRLVFGEIRGHEAKGFCEALIMGHAAALSTIHASSALEATSRLFSLGEAYGLKGVNRREDEKEKANKEYGKIPLGVIVLKRGEPPEVAHVQVVECPF